MRFVVTGSTGFLGRNFVQTALASGHDIAVLLRPESNYDCLPANPQLSRFHCPDPLDFESPSNALLDWQPDCMFHFGWRGVASSDRNTAFQITENLPHAIRSVQLAHRLGARQWISVGSQAEYGLHDRRMDEGTPCSPTTIYGKSKLATGMATQALAETLGMASTWIRVFSVYGPGDDPNHLLPLVTRQLLSGEQPALTRCEQLWDFLHVDDATKAFVALAEHEASGVFNLASGRAQPLRDTVEAIRSRIGPCPEVDYGAIPYSENQVMHLEGDISQIQRSTNWSPSVDLEEGLATVVEDSRRQLASTVISQSTP